MKTNQKQMWSAEESPRLYTRRRIEKACVGNQPTLTAFVEWLGERGLAPRSVTTRLHATCTFLDAVTADTEAPCVQALSSLAASDIEDFFIQYGADHGMGSRRNMRSAMRSFLKFADSQGWVERQLADAVPSLPSYRLSSLPRGLKDEELQTLLSSPWEVGPCPLRDQAIVYTLATYGVRREQISDLRLADIDWHEKSIVFAAHKGGKAIHHTLTHAVAQAMADYLRQQRPASDCDYVFLRQIPPHVQLSPSAVTKLVTARMVRCGLPPRSPHALRHAFATRLLQAGESVKAIADLLGHHSLAAVAIYAKVDYERLLEVAIEWPEVTS